MCDIFFSLRESAAKRFQGEFQSSFSNFTLDDFQELLFTVTGGSD